MVMMSGQASHCPRHWQACHVTAVCDACHGLRFLVCISHKSHLKPGLMVLLPFVLELILQSLKIQLGAMTDEKPSPRALCCSELGIWQQTALRDGCHQSEGGDYYIPKHDICSPSSGVM